MCAKHVRIESRMKWRLEKMANVLNEVSATFPEIQFVVAC